MKENNKLHFILDMGTIILLAGFVLYMLATNNRYTFIAAILVSIYAFNKAYDSRIDWLCSSAYLNILNRMQDDVKRNSAIVDRKMDSIYETFESEDDVAEDAVKSYMNMRYDFVSLMVSYTVASERMASIINTMSRFIFIMMLRRYNSFNKIRAVYSIGCDVNKSINGIYSDNHSRIKDDMYGLFAEIIPEIDTNKRTVTYVSHQKITQFLDAIELFDTYKYILGLVSRITPNGYNVIVNTSLDEKLEEFIKQYYPDQEQLSKKEMTMIHLRASKR